MLSEWLISLEGTDEGHQLALGLTILAAILHAFFGALQKGRHDPWLSRSVIDFCYALMAAPIALFVVPWPEPHMWSILATAVGIHIVYKIFQALAYTRGSYIVVYPVVRGSSPIFAVIGAYLLFQETFTPTQLVGLFMLVGGIFGFAGYNWRTLQIGRATLAPALMLALFTGALVAVYTTWDAFGVRATADPFTFLAWFFFLDGLILPVFGYRRWRKMADRPAVGPLMARGLIGGLVAYFSFGFIILATRLDKVGEAAVLRETSVVFAALIGWLLLKEKVGAARVALMALIAAGAVIVEIGG